MIVFVNKTVTAKSRLCIYYLNELWTSKIMHTTLGFYVFQIYYSCNTCFAYCIISQKSNKGNMCRKINIFVKHKNQLLYALLFTNIIFDQEASVDTIKMALDQWKIIEGSTISGDTVLYPLSHLWY